MNEHDKVGLIAQEASALVDIVHGPLTARELLIADKAAFCGANLTLTLARHHPEVLPTLFCEHMDEAASYSVLALLPQ